MNGKVNKNPTRCNSMQIFIYCKDSLHVLGVLKTVTTVSGTGHNTSTATSLQRPDQATLEGSRCTSIMTCTGLWLQFLVLLMMGAVIPETCRVTLQ